MSGPSPSRCADGSNITLTVDPVGVLQECCRADDEIEGQVVHLPANINERAVEDFSCRARDGVGRADHFARIVHGVGDAGILRARYLL